VEADLLVVPLGPQKNYVGRRWDLEWLTDVIPCNLWVIRGTLLGKNSKKINAS
jgi:hypothetical protein